MRRVHNSKLHAPPTRRCSRESASPPSLGLCIFAKASHRLGKGAPAWSALQRALRIAAEHRDVCGAAFAAVSALRQVAECQAAARKMGAAAVTLRRVTTILENSLPRDKYTVACARVDESAAHIGAGVLSEAERLLRGALPVLRKRKGEFTRAGEAAKLLAALVRPRKRIRGRTHPECVDVVDAR